LSSTAAEHLLLTSPVHAWTVTQDDKVRECEIIYTLPLTLQFGKSFVRLNMLMIMHGHGSQRQLPHVIRWSVYKPSSHEHFVMCMWPYYTGITSVLESRLYLQSKHMTSPLSSHFQPNVSGEYSTEEFSHPTALNCCQQPSLFSTVMGVASLQIQTRFLVPLSSQFKSPVRDFRPVSLLRFHMIQT